MVDQDAKAACKEGDQVRISLKYCDVSTCFVAIYADAMVDFIFISVVDYPAGTQYQNDVVSTSMRRDHVASTLIRRHFNVVCPLGKIVL